LRRAVAAVPGVERVSVAGSGEEALARWHADNPGLVLMDVRMPGLGGIEAARRILAADPGATVIMMTVGEDVDGVTMAVGTGASGYLMKDASREEIAATVSYALADLRGSRRSGSVAIHRSGAGPLPALTEREMQVLAGMSRGRSNADIGRELYLSEDTVKTHARRLFRKLGAADRAQAVALGFRWGLVR
jgi:DNA-binding NarL/FixJ family response regulator